MADSTNAAYSLGLQVRDVVTVRRRNCEAADKLHDVSTLG